MWAVVFGSKSHGHSRAGGSKGRGNNRESVSDSAPWGTLEAAGHPPMNLGSITEAPDRPQLSGQLPSSPSPFDKSCASSKAPALNSGGLDHLAND